MRLTSQNAIYDLIFTSLYPDQWTVVALEVPRVNTMKAEEVGMGKIGFHFLGNSSLQNHYISPSIVKNNLNIYCRMDCLSLQKLLSEGRRFRYSLLESTIVSSFHYEVFPVLFQ